MASDYGLSTAVDKMVAKNKATTVNTQSFQTLWDSAFKDVINPLITIIFAASLLIFLWGVVSFILNADSESERRKGAQRMIWGLVGMFIMMASFAIVTFIKGTVTP